MADTAAHLVDRVFPEVPIRQWVLSLPLALRYRLAYDSQLVSEVLRIFIQVVFSSLRRRARKRVGIQKGPCGAVTFVQRFGGSLNLNIHLHSLVLDGVSYMDDKKQMRFQRLPQPSDSEVRQVTERVAGGNISAGWSLDKESVSSKSACGPKPRRSRSLTILRAIRSVIYFASGCA